MDNQSAVQEAISFLHDDLFSSLTIETEDNHSGNVLTVIRKGNKASISYGKRVELFYGLTLLKEHKAEPEFSLTLTSRFLHNGLMHDCSRNAVLNVTQAKQEILIHALLGLNRFMLYTEDTYEIEGEPYFGYFRGRYSKEELQELVSYGERFGVELIPCIQTLSHLNQALRWRKRYGELLSSAQTLKIGEEKTYELIDKMLKTISETFHSRTVHIGMDEAIDIGVYDYLYHNKMSDRKTLMLSHLKRVVDLCNKYHLKPMMWTDMFFKIDEHAADNWYDFQGLLSDEVKKNIPEEVELVYWDYYHDDVATYDRMIKTTKDTGRNVIFASGMIRWIGFVPNFSCSLRKCEAGLKAAVANHISSLIATTWGDGGSEGTVVSSYPFLALHSLYDYYGTSDPEMLDRLVSAVTSQNMAEWTLLQCPNEISGKELLPFENPSKPFLYNDPLLGLFDSRSFDRYEAIYKEHASKLKIESRKSLYFGYAYATLADLCDLLSLKVTLGRKTREAYAKNDRFLLEEYLKQWKIVNEKLSVFMTSYREQWMKENKPFGFEVTDGRLGFLKERISTAIWTLENYLSGKTPSIPELEEKVLPYDGAPDEEAHCYNDWADIASASIIR